MKLFEKTFLIFTMFTSIAIFSQTKTTPSKLETFLGNYESFTPPNKIEIKIGDYDDYAKFALVKKDDTTIIKTDGFFEEVFTFKDGVLTKSTFVNTEKLYFKYFELITFSFVFKNEISALVLNNLLSDVSIKLFLFAL